MVSKVLEITRRYKQIFEDDLIVVHIGKGVLRVITKLDSSAYDIPLESIRKAFPINEGRRVLCNECVNLHKCGHIYRFQLNRNGNCPAYNKN